MHVIYLYFLIKRKRLQVFVEKCIASIILCGYLACLRPRLHPLVNKWKGGREVEVFTKED